MINTLEKDKAFLHFPRLPLLALWLLHWLRNNQITSIRVKDLKDPAELFFRGAHHHRKLRLIETLIAQAINGATVSIMFGQSYRHIFSKVHAPAVVFVKHAVHGVAQDAPLHQDGDHHR